MTSEILDEIETWSPQRVAALESDQLVTQLDYVNRNSEFYSAKFLRAGVAPSSIRSVADLPNLPFTEKAELRQSLADTPPLGGHLAVDRRALLQVQATSGTTGSPSFLD